jgi:hypothetical protein
METVKRAYAKPTILKVQLSHEQAVLAACSTSSKNLSQGGTNNQCNPSGCRKSSKSGSQDSLATS